jgi:hypothetical protein
VTIIASYHGDVAETIRGRVMTGPAIRKTGTRHHAAIAAIYVTATNRTLVAFEWISPDETRIEMRFGEPYLTEAAMTEITEAATTGPIVADLMATAADLLTGAETTRADHADPR